MTFTVYYVAGPYSGMRDVSAEDEEQAIAIVRSRIRREMSLTMYAESYRVIYAPSDQDHLASLRDSGRR